MPRDNFESGSNNNSEAASNRWTEAFNEEELPTREDVRATMLKGASPASEVSPEPSEDPSPASEVSSEPPEDPDDIFAGEAERSKEAAKIRAERKAKLRRNSGLKKYLTGLLLGVTATIALSSPFSRFQGTRNNPTPVQTEQTQEDDGAANSANDQLDIDLNTETEADLDIPAVEEGQEQSPYVGELANGVTYDYREYADSEHKTSKYDYGYDKSICFNNREVTEKAWMEMASKGPEYLSSYAYYALTDEEKQALGIAGMSSKEIDDYLSNSNNIDGGAKQKEILSTLERIARDKDNTSYNWYYENNQENTYYIVFNDVNGDGKYSPDELELCYANMKRNNEPQVDVYRMINGKMVKVLDLNMNCGLQPNFVNPPEDLPPLPPDNPTPEKPDKPETPDNPPETPPDDAKDPNAIEKNMQTGSETTNRVDQQGPGELKERPSTKGDSYKAEKEQQEKRKKEAKEQPTKGKSGSTVGDAINDADQTKAEHKTTTSTPAQEDDRRRQEEAQRKADEAAKKAKKDAEEKSTMNDQQAAEWFNSMQKGN